MNPSNQAPLDYLNQIAPTEARKSPFKLGPKLFIIIGIVLVLVVIILSVTVSNLNSSRREPWQTLSARLDTTEKIANSSANNIKNSQLRSLNSDVKIYLTNTKRDLQTPLTAQSIKATELPASITTKEANAAMTARLETGRLNAKYDSTYAREMSYQLSTILTLLQRLYASSGSTTNKAFLKTAYDNLAPTQKAIAEFSASNE